VKVNQAAQQLRNYNGLQHLSNRHFDSNLSPNSVNIQWNTEWWSTGCNYHTQINKKSSWYGLISLKFPSLHFLSKCPYSSHKQHSVSDFSPPFDCPTPNFVPHTDCSIYSTVKWTINAYLDIRFRCLKQSLKLLKITVVNYNSWYFEPPRNSASIKLPLITLLYLQKPSRVYRL
jgi:hypothetical protein